MFASVWMVYCMSCREWFTYLFKCLPFHMSTLPLTSNPILNQMAAKPDTASASAVPVADPGARYHCLAMEVM